MARRRVPFTYTLQARYLVANPQVLSPAALAGIVALQLLGYAIFRGANAQKDAFRANPNDPALARAERAARGGPARGALTAAAAARSQVH